MLTLIIKHTGSGINFLSCLRNQNHRLAHLRFGLGQIRFAPDDTASRRVDLETLFLVEKRADFLIQTGKPFLGFRIGRFQLFYARPLNLLIFDWCRHQLSKFIPAMLPLLELTFALVLAGRRLFAGNHCFIPPSRQVPHFGYETFDAFFVVLILGCYLSQGYFQSLKLCTLLFSGFLSMLDSLLKGSDLRTRRIECCLPVTDLLLRCHFIRPQTFNLVFKAALPDQMGFNFRLCACS